MSKLQRIQNSAAWLVCSTPRFNHITPVLFCLHWVPIAYRIEFKILVLMFKAIYQLAPSCICNLVRLKEKCKYKLYYYYYYYYYYHYYYYHHHVGCESSFLVEVLFFVFLSNAVHVYLNMLIVLASHSTCKFLLFFFSTVLKNVRHLHFKM